MKNYSKDIFGNVLDFDNYFKEAELEIAKYQIQNKKKIQLCEFVTNFLIGVNAVYWVYWTVWTIKLVKKLFNK